MFLMNLHGAKLMHDTAYLAITYWKWVPSYLSKGDGSILHVHRSQGFGEREESAVNQHN